MILGLSFTGSGQDDWHLLSHPGENLVIVDDNHGYAFVNESVGSHGSRYYLNKSGDGMKTFATVLSNVGDFGCYSLDEIFFINKDTGFIAELCQGIARILVTTDGGQSWSPLDAGGTFGMSLCFLNPGLGYYCFLPGGTNTSYLFRFQSGVAINLMTTTRYILAKDNYLYPGHTAKIRFVNDSTGFIICKDSLDHAVALKTTDWGNNWSEMINLEGHYFRDLFFPSEAVGFIIGSQGLILKTEDAGNMWTEITGNTSQTLTTIDINPQGTGHIAGMGGMILKTTDFGNTWDPVSFINAENLIHVKTTGDGHCYVNTAGGDLFTNGDYEGLRDRNHIEFQIYPNPAHDKLLIDLTGGVREFEYHLYNITGEIILRGKNSGTIGLNALPAGLYGIRIITPGKQGSKIFLVN